MHRRFCRFNEERICLFLLPLLVEALITTIKNNVEEKPALPDTVQNAKHSVVTFVPNTEIGTKQFSI